MWTFCFLIGFCGAYGLALQEHNYELFGGDP
jgi:hypothetical protein